MKFFSNVKKRLKSQKGMSGVIVALLLVVVGVGLIAGMNTFMKAQVAATQTAAETEIAKAIQATSSSN